ncbi:MAG: LamG-like jellyroll fold domain-containing protein, partial [bacterium]
MSFSRMSTHLFIFTLILLIAGSAAGQRVTEGLQVLYGFQEESGPTVTDVSGVGTPVDLTIADQDSVAWVPGGGLIVNGSTIISSGGAATKVSNAVAAANEITLEAWVTPADLTQEGPARIVGISENTNFRNVHLAQGANLQPPTVYSTRLRTSTTNTNGEPSVFTSAGSLTTNLTHVVFTRDTAGNVYIYLDGSEAFAGTIGGDMSGWDSGYPLLLANETTGDRPWLGEYSLVAVYSRALSPIEVGLNYSAGPGLGPLPPFIATHPQNVTVAEGNTATFKVIAGGTAPLSYQWQRNGFDITGADSSVYTTPPTTLPEDGDTFRCVVTNAQGDVTSNSATLYVYEPSAYYRIMPLGDSITFDNHSGDTRPDSERVGYRYPLWQMLTDAGYIFGFVGSMYQGWDYIPDPQDCHHEGHGGWQDYQIRDNIIGWLNSTPADIILLHIGTNGLSADETEVAQILDNIDTWEAANHPVWVIVARIVNRSSSDALPDPDYIGSSSLTTTFNDNVEAMVNARSGDQVIMVDIEHGMDIDYRRQPAGDMWESPDTLHPNEYGYAKMANGWYQALINLLPTPPITCPAGMGHYWRMEKEIPAYVDNVGYSVVYAPIPPTQVDGIVNKAQLYSGAQETNVRDDDSFDWGPTDSFSLEFWMKKDIPVGGNQVQNNEVILGRDDPSTDLHWWLGVCATASPSGAACFQLRATDSSGGAIYSTTDLDNGEWHHVAATRDGAGNWNRLYVDGYLEAEDQFTYGAGFDADGILMDIGWLDLPQYYHYN